MLLCRAENINAFSEASINAIDCSFGTRITLIEQLNSEVCFSASLNLEVELSHANFCVQYV